MDNVYIKQEGQKIEKFLSHSFESVTVEHVKPDVVPLVNAENRKDEYQAYYLIKIPPETEQDILNLRCEINEYMYNQLEEMERLSPAPDTLIVCKKHPPEHIKKYLYFYVISTL